MRLFLLNADTLVVEMPDHLVDASTGVSTIKQLNDWNAFWVATAHDCFPEGILAKVKFSLLWKTMAHGYYFPVLEDTIADATIDMGASDVHLSFADDAKIKFAKLKKQSQHIPERARSAPPLRTGIPGGDDTNLNSDPTSARDPAAEGSMPCRLLFSASRDSQRKRAASSPSEDPPPTRQRASSVPLATDTVDLHIAPPLPPLPRPNDTADFAEHPPLRAGGCPQLLPSGQSGRLFWETMAGYYFAVLEHAIATTIDVGALDVKLDLTDGAKVKIAQLKKRESERTRYVPLSKLVLRRMRTPVTLLQPLIQLLKAMHYPLPTLSHGNTRPDRTDVGRPPSKRQRTSSVPPTSDATAPPLPPLPQPNDAPDLVAHPAIAHWYRDHPWIFKFSRHPTHRSGSSVIRFVLIQQQLPANGQRVSTLPKDMAALLEQIALDHAVAPTVLVASELYRR
ncbi:hypothetical protein DXG03_008865 [Asterophora parasitica]|uniref:Uncharacterized protein n=1 Tax=Asterophora parasitica TaxID=117018 RepID=A0A9P7GBW5_9AGAR|nr:hypothetical protein DXG03_008865 [Asterophora parasitica]